MAFWRWLRYNSQRFDWSTTCRGSACLDELCFNGIQDSNGTVQAQAVCGKDERSACFGLGFCFHNFKRNKHKQPWQNPQFQSPIYPIRLSLLLAQSGTQSYQWMKNILLTQARPPIPALALTAVEMQREEQLWFDRGTEGISIWSGRIQEEHSKKWKKETARKGERPTFPVAVEDGVPDPRTTKIAVAANIALLVL